MELKRGKRQRKKVPVSLTLSSGLDGTNGIKREGTLEFLASLILFKAAEKGEMSRRRRRRAGTNFVCVKFFFGSRMVPFY